MTDELQDAPWALPDAPWAAPTPPPEPESVPPSFLHRIATGLAIGGAADASPEELRQKGYEDFNLSANTAQAFKNGVKNFAEAKTGIQRAGGVLEAAASPLTALFQAIGGAGEKATGGLLTSESVQDALMLQDGVLGRFSRVRGGAEQVIGSLPKDGDFATGAKALDSAAAEQNLRDLWAERGIHPAEAVHDAQSDAFLKQDIAPPSFVAFHGSPYSFDAFDINKIGTGEGAQSYGHGLYFAENPAVAQDYKGKLSTLANVNDSAEANTALTYLARNNFDKAAARADLEESLRQKLPDTHRLVEAINNYDPGHLYQVRINADPDHFLDWDKPLSEQSPQVRDALLGAGVPDKAHVTGELAYQHLVGDQIAAGRVKPQASSAGHPGYALVTDQLRQAGIPGIKYLDQGSRAGGEGTRNYVVFDHNDVEITHKNGVPLTRSETAPVRGTPMPDGTPRSELAKTGEAHIDKILESPVTQRAIDNAVIDRSHTVPYTAGGSVPLEDPTFFIDHRFPQTFTINGATFDPAEPFAIHENLEQHTMEMLLKGGMGQEEAYRVAHFEFAEKAEGAWYKAHGIDQAKAEAAYAPYMAAIQKSPAGNVPENLYTRPYPHDNPSAAQREPIAEARPSKDEIARAKAILDSQEAGGALRPLGADIAQDTPDLTQQPPRPAGSLLASAKDSLNRLFDMGRDLQMNTAPMAMGTAPARAIAKDFANAMRRNRWEWNRIDSDIAKRFTPEQRKRMWDAADEESVLRQEGKTSEYMGLATLEPEERAAIEELQTRGQLAWAQARDTGMVQGEGLPAYTPRMVVNAASAVSGDKAIPLNGLGANLRTRTAQMMRRKYLTAEETEAAAKAKLGEGAEIARDIRALPLATAHLEDAIAGRKLIDAIRDYGRRTGAETVADGWQPDNSWFTLDHPSFRTFRPRLEEVDGAMRAARDQDGNMIFDQVPLYVHGDFEGPLRSVLNVRKGAQTYSGALYGGLMALKGKTMGLIMNSPLIHNAVEWGRALPAMPGKVASFKIYFEGNRAKNDVGTMREAIDAGLVPIGKRFFNQDITSIMEEPNLAPGRSRTAQVLGAVPGLFDEGAGNAVKAAIDKAGDFWHNTLLWDRVADLQMGLYTNFRDELLSKGVHPSIANRAAAHWANRYAGALPKEAMSDAATKISNMLLFSRTFTMGNLGAMKDMLTGLPKDVLAQIERDAGFTEGSLTKTGEEAEAARKSVDETVKFAKTMARRKAIAVVALDVGLFYVGNSILQSALNVMKGDSTLDQEMHGYAQRLSQALQERKEHPLKLLQPFDFLQSLSSTSENEPGKADRIKVGHAADGTAIYLRNPAGKIGEEFIDYLTGNELDMIRRKLGTIARPAWQILSNDKGFGRKVYDPNADTPEKYLRNVGNIAQHLAGSQLPEGQIGAFSDLVKGEGDPNVNAAQAFGPLAGMTFAKGAPGGEAVGEMYNARTEHNYAVDAELPDIRRQIQRGDEQGARDRMTQLGIPRGLQNFYVRTSRNPATRLSGKALRDFYLYATPEQKARMENLRP